MASSRWSGHTVHMLDVRALKAQDLRGLSPDALAAAAEQMLAHIGEQSKHIGEQRKRSSTPWCWAYRGSGSRNCSRSRGCNCPRNCTTVIRQRMARTMQLAHVRMASSRWSGHTVHMLDARHFTAQDLRGLSPDALAAAAEKMLAHISEQSKHIGEQTKRIESQAQAIKWRDAKIESITSQLARLKAWKFGAKTEAMNAEQRALFDETCAADQASLEAQLAALQHSPTAGGTAPDKQPRRSPKREPLPAHLPRVDQRVEPEDTNCPTPECGQPMVRVGEDISERLDIIPAQFFGLAGRVGPEGQPLVRHKASSGRVVSALGNARSGASGPAGAAS